METITAYNNIVSEDVQKTEFLSSDYIPSNGTKEEIGITGAAEDGGRGSNCPSNILEGPPKNRSHV